MIVPSIQTINLIVTFFEIGLLAVRSVTKMKNFPIFATLAIDAQMAVSRKGMNYNGYISCNAFRHQRV